MHSYFLSHLGNCDDNSEIEIEGDEALALQMYLGLNDNELD